MNKLGTDHVCAKYSDPSKFHGQYGMIKKKLKFLEHQWGQCQLMLLAFPKRSNDTDPIDSISSKRAKILCSVCAHSVCKSCA